MRTALTSHEDERKVHLLLVTAAAAAAAGPAKW